MKNEPDAVYPTEISLIVQIDGFKSQIDGF